MLKKLFVVASFAVAMAFSAGVAHADSITINNVTYTGTVTSSQVIVTVQCMSAACSGWYLEDVSLKGFTWTGTPILGPSPSGYTLELGGMNVANGCDGQPVNSALCWEDSSGLLNLGMGLHIFTANISGGSFMSSGSLSLQALGFGSDSTSAAGGNKTIAVSTDLVSTPEPGTLLLLGIGLLGLAVVRRRAPSA